MNREQAKFQKILDICGNMVTGPSDLLADQPPSRLFWFTAKHFSALLSGDAKVAISEKGIRWRRRLHPIIKKLGPGFLANPQVFENRNYLRAPDAATIAPDNGITLPDRPVIWAPNHAFKDDPLASVLAAQRHAYMLFGSLPQIFNTVDGLTAWLNGIIAINRKSEASRRTSVEKGCRALNCGVDLILYLEGILNKTANELILHLWPGIYRIACETGAPIVPIVHYLRDMTNTEPDNPIHTVVDDPIQIDQLSEKAALEYLRDVMATWFYLMMERYGKTTRAELLRGANSPQAAWEKNLRGRLGLIDRYDKEIELSADYRPKDIIRPETVWAGVASIDHITPQNAAHVAYAVNLVEELRRQDYQRRF